MLILWGRNTLGKDDSGIPDDDLVEPSQIDDADPALLGKVCIGIPECVSADLDCTADNSRKLAHAEVEKKSVAGVDTSSIRTNEARWMKPDKMKEVDLNDSGNVASLMVKNEEKNCTCHLHETKQFYLGYGFEKHKHQLKITRDMITILWHHKPDPVSSYQNFSLISAIVMRQLCLQQDQSQKSTKKQQHTCHAWMEPSSQQCYVSCSHWE